MEYMIAPLKKYADFQGRARRMEYWMFALGEIILFCVLTGLIAATGGYNDEGPSALSTVFWAIYGIAALALIIPGIAVSVRRLHDTNRSGWWIFISLVPLIGGIWYFVLTVLDGTPGPNRFGPDPKGRGETVASTFA